MRLLDCTLRDGAHINQGNFGRAFITDAVRALTISGIDRIELGFLEDVTRIEGCTYFPDVQSAEEYLPSECTPDNICLLTRPDRFDHRKLQCRATGIKHIRVAFYAKDLALAIHCGKHLNDLGFMVSFNPIAITTVPRAEIQKICRALSFEDFETLSIVDTYGAFTLEAFVACLEIFTEFCPGEKLGLHLHENLSSSFTLAQLFSERCPGGVIDCSMTGMGRAPGNLPTELIASFLNRYKKSDYKILTILDFSEDRVLPLKSVGQWGYEAPYMVSAINNIDRTRAEECINSGMSHSECYSKLVTGQSNETL